MRSDAGKIQTFCYAGPALVEWGAPAESASSCGDYDWVAPFTAVASPAWRERFSAWEQDREWRPFLPLPVLLADGKLAAKFAHALKKKADEDLEELNGNLDKEDLYKEVIESAVRLIEDARRLRTESLFVLIPRPELREKPFAKWTAADEATAGYSALYDIAEGKLYFSVGVRSRDEMRRPRREVERFLGEKRGELANFRQRCPELFEQEEPQVE